MKNRPLSLVVGFWFAKSFLFFSLDSLFVSGIIKASGRVTPTNDTKGNDNEYVKFLSGQD